MRLTWRKALLLAAAALVWTGCSTSPPGAGLTNGEPLGSEGSEKAAQRTDLPTPNLTGGEALAEPAATSPTAAPAGGPGPQANPPTTEGTGNPTEARGSGQPANSGGSGSSNRP